MRRLQWLPFSILAASSVGVIITAALASIEIREQAYLTLNLPLNALSTFLNATRDGMLAGALVGAVLFVVVAVFQFGCRAARLEQGPGWLPYFLCMSVTLFVIAGRAFVHDHIGIRRIWCIIALAALWSGFLTLSRSPLMGRHPILSRFVTTNLYVVPALILAMAFLLDMKSVGLIRNPGVFVAVFATYAACIVAVGRLSSNKFASLPPPPWLLTTPVFLSLLLLVVSPMLIPPGLTLNRPANVLLIGIDTLRTDHTSLLEGSKRDTSPHLAALAARGTVFEAAISQAPWTMPSFGSVMTGRYPREHGAISLSGLLKSEEVTMAEMLREAGFQTAAIVSHIFVDAAHGFAQGFDAYDESNVLGHHSVTSVKVSDLAIEKLGKSLEEPFFLFLHYFDPHYEYRDHAGIDYADGYQGWLRDSELEIGHLRDRRHDLSKADLGYLRDLYDEEIAFTDAQIGRVLSYLKESGLDDRTIIVVVADHGEEFMERGWLGHTTSLYEELIRVPLIIALPPGEAQVASVTTSVETRAILATLMDFMGLEPAGDVLQASLLPHMKGKANQASAEPAYSEVWLPDASIDRRLRMSSLRTDRWKLVRNSTRNEERLYDLDTDPGERTDLFETETEQAQNLRSLLEAWLQAMDKLDGEAPRADLTNEQLDQLRSLGYIK